MANAIVTKSDSIEGQVAEVAQALQLKEEEQSTADNPLNNVQITINADARQMQITVTLPVLPVIGGDGVISYPAAPYLADE